MKVAKFAATADSLSHVTWQMDAAVVPPCGAVRASGNASPQVRNAQRLAALGDTEAQIDHIRRMIVDALAHALEGMQPTIDDLNARRDEIASLTLVSANMKLGGVGVSLLDLRIEELDFDY